MVQVGARIKLLRKQKKLTQAQLAKVVGVDATLINKIEKGHTTSSLNTLNKIAEALNVSIIDLLEEYSQKNDHKSSTA